MSGWVFFWLFRKVVFIDLEYFVFNLKICFILMFLVNCVIFELLFNILFCVMNLKLLYFVILKFLLILIFI